METWKMYVELEFPVQQGDLEEKHAGDSQVDFANRAVERVRPHLNKLLEDTEFVHYFIMPTKNARARR